MLFQKIGDYGVEDGNWGWKRKIGGADGLQKDGKISSYLFYMCIIRQDLL
jgi:hypothetical protein